MSAIISSTNSYSSFKGQLERSESANNYVSSCSLNFSRHSKNSAAVDLFATNRQHAVRACSRKVVWVSFVFESGEFVNDWQENVLS